MYSNLLMSSALKYFYFSYMYASRKTKTILPKIYCGIRQRPRCLRHGVPASVRLAQFKDVARICKM